MDEIMVSINCIVYNHGRYLREALDSFLMQKTDFKFEILIHDDASTDNSAEIIREYHEKYPELIRPLIQEENQYSKGRDVFYEFNHRRARGKYVAVCEGDDCWTDEYKLQKQVDYMEANPDCTLCFHNGRLVNEETGERERLVVPWMVENKKYFYGKDEKYDSGKLQLLGFVPTASLMFPRYVMDNPPDWIFRSPVGDPAIRLLASSYGYAYYMDEEMCIYRFKVPGSATTRWTKQSQDQMVERCTRFLNMLDEFNEYTDHRYKDDIELSKLTVELSKLKLTYDARGLKEKRLRRYLELLEGSEKLKYSLILYFPSGYVTLKKLVDSLKGGSER